RWALREKPERRHLGAHAIEPRAPGARARAERRALAGAPREWLRLPAAWRDADLFRRLPGIAEAARRGGGAGAARNPVAQRAAFRFRAEAEPALQRQALRCGRFPDAELFRTSRVKSIGHVGQHVRRPLLRHL